MLASSEGFRKSSMPTEDTADKTEQPGTAADPNTDGCFQLALMQLKCCICTEVPRAGTQQTSTKVVSRILILIGYSLGLFLNLRKSSSHQCVQITFGLQYPFSKLAAQITEQIMGNLQRKVKCQGGRRHSCQAQLAKSPLPPKQQKCD